MFAVSPWKDSLDGYTPYNKAQMACSARMPCHVTTRNQNAERTRYPGGWVPETDGIHEGKVIACLFSNTSNESPPSSLKQMEVLKPVLLQKINLRL